MYLYVNSSARGCNISTLSFLNHLSGIIKLRTRSAYPSTASKREMIERLSLLNRPIHFLKYILNQFLNIKFLARIKMNLTDDKNRRINANISGKLFLLFRETLLYMSGCAT